MKTKLYGCSDDLIELDGRFYEEVGCYSEAEDGVPFEFSDGTKGTIRYFGDWTISVDTKGDSFEKVVKCKGEVPHTDADAKGYCAYSDVLVMRDGIEWVIVKGEKFK